MSEKRRMNVWWTVAVVVAMIVGLLGALVGGLGWASGNVARRELGAIEERITGIGDQFATGAQGIPKTRITWAVLDKLTTQNDGEVWGSLLVDTINEYTSGSGVTIDSVDLLDDAVTAADLTATDDVSVGDALDVVGSAIVTGSLSVDTINENTTDNGISIESVDLKDSDIDAEDINADNVITASNGLVSLGSTTLARDVEHLGALSFITESITYTAGAGTSGTLATIADGEVWLIYDVFIQTTTTFTDTTGNDEAFTIGDGNDADGFISASSTELDSTFTEATGYQAGFYGIENGSNGAYAVDDGIFVYAPSGSSETIDYVLSSGAGDDIGAGALTMYLTYARIK